MQVASFFGEPISKGEKISYLLKNWKSILRIWKLESRPNSFSLLLKHGAQSNRLKSFLEKNNLNYNETLFYTYWLDEGAVILGLIKEKIKGLKSISRAHGYDLYEEDYPNGLPYFYQYAVSKLNRIYFISNDGKEYFSKKHKLEISKEVSKLGTMDYGIGPEEGEDIVIATCSSIIPLKRLELLAEALAKIENIEITWHHHGDGPLKTDVIDKLSNAKNITTHFYGHVSNDELMNFYKNTYISLFINVSRTEGLPLSLVEAASFGIPLLATNVRGTSEICNSETGILVDSDSSPEELAKRIQGALNSKWDRSDIRKFWEMNFLGTKNFKSFAKQITEL